MVLTVLTQFSCKVGHILRINYISRTLTYIIWFDLVVLYRHGSFIHVSSCCQETSSLLPPRICSHACLHILLCPLLWRLAKCRQRTLSFFLHTCCSRGPLSLWGCLPQISHLDDIWTLKSPYIYPLSIHPYHPCLCTMCNIPHTLIFCRACIKVLNTTQRGTRNPKSVLYLF